MQTKPVYTVGHSTHSLEHLQGLLLHHRITAVADVRSRPYSRWNPQFNREPFATALKQLGVAYVFMGHQLGGRFEDPACYVDGQVRYDLVAKTPRFRKGLERVVAGAADYRIALMCAEKDPLTCHRSILVCRHLALCNVEPLHILADGELETHESALARLCDELGIAGPELFDHSDPVQRAYEMRGLEIAYSEAA